MKKDVEKLSSAVGEIVTSVAVDVLFHSVQLKGYLGPVWLNLAGGKKFILGCAGDGGIYVVLSRKPYADAPGFIAERRIIAGISGILHDVSVAPDALQLAIGKHKVIAVNQDDELLVTVDGVPLPQQLFERGAL